MNKMIDSYMENWKEYKLHEIGEIVGGATPSTKDSTNYDGEISWITPKDLSNFIGRYIQRGERSITQKGFDSSSCQILPKGSILFSSRAPIGYIAIAANELCTNQGFKSVIPYNNVVDNIFLYYLLKYNKKKIEGLGSGTTFKEVSAKVMQNFEIRIPCIQTQKRIVNILSSLDDKIELNRRINDNLEQQAQALFNEMFPHITEGENMIGDLIMPKRGKGLLSKNAIKGDIPVVAGGIEPATYHNQANTTAPVLTIAASGANAGYINLWHIPVWASDSSYIDDSITPNVYFWYIMLKKRQKEIFDAQVGSAQPHIYPKHIAELPMNVAFVEKIAEYNEIITPIFEKKGQLFLESKRLTSLRDTLLPKLMSGELKINDINN